MCPFLRFQSWLPSGSVIRNLPANVGGSGRSLGQRLLGRNGSTLQHSCLENSNAQRSLAVAEEAAVQHGAAKSPGVMKHACTRLPSTCPEAHGSGMSPTPLNSSIYPSNQCHCVAHSMPVLMPGTKLTSAPTTPSVTEQDIISAQHPQASPAPKTQTAGDLSVMLMG